jgi:hypothetical protein
MAKEQTIIKEKQESVNLQLIGGSERGPVFDEVCTAVQKYGYLDNESFHLPTAAFPYSEATSSAIWHGPRGL